MRNRRNNNRRWFSALKTQIVLATMGLALSSTGCNPDIKLPDVNIEFSLLGVFLDAEGNSFTMSSD